MQKTKLLSSFAWLQWNPAEFYFGPNLPNGADVCRLTQKVWVSLLNEKVDKQCNLNQDR